MKLHLESPNIHLVFQRSNYGNVNVLKKEEISPTCLCLNNRFPDTNFICQKRYHHSIVETAVITLCIHYVLERFSVSMKSAEKIQGADKMTMTL